MGTSSPESTTSSLRLNNSDANYLSANHDEIENLREAKKQAENKLELLREHYKEEVSLFNDVRVERILTNSGAREYLERLKEKAKLKDETIKHLKEALDYKSKEVQDLQNRCKKAERLSQEYMQAFKSAQKARLDNDGRASQSSRDQRNPHSADHQANNMSTTSSFVDNTVPPRPPPLEVPIDEILRPAPSSRGPELFTNFTSSVPPPPELDAPMNELLQSDDERAFEQEKGQFLSHVYASVDTKLCEDIDDIIELVEAEQKRTPNQAYRGWKVINHNPDEEENNLITSNQFHVTLIRGHRAIYQHQINSIVQQIKSDCNNSDAFCLCLDRLRLFYNHERTKQFLCLATREEAQTRDSVDLGQLKRRLRDTIDQFATKLTEEDETDDTLVHCSLMSREVQQVQGQEQDSASDLKEIKKLCTDNLTDEHPICLVQVNKIHIKIGNRVYDFNLACRI